MNAATDILAWLKASGMQKTVLSMARFGIPSDRAFGVPMGEMRKKAKANGMDHDAARKLWQTGRYEAQIMAVLVADPDKLTSEEADDWCAAFDNWAICDTACFALIDRTAYRWEKVHQWCNDPREYVRRAGFALIWALTTHDKAAEDAVFEDAMTLMEVHASDDRPIVKKAIDMALRATGKRNRQLLSSAIALCNRLAKLEGSAGWIGRHALKELQSTKVLARLQKRGR